MKNELNTVLKINNAFKVLKAALFSVLQTWCLIHTHLSEIVVSGPSG